MGLEAAGSLLARYERAYAVVRAIPRGRVMTYGQIAELAVCGGPVPAVTIGRAMAASGRYAPDLPWWRVIGRAGAWGVLRKRQLSLLQRDLLAAEGIKPDGEGRYDLGRYLHTPEA